MITAKTTMTSPESSACPNCALRMVSSTAHPISSKPPITAAMITIDSAAIRHWFTPTMIWVLAAGISIRNSCCRRFAPLITAASLISGSTRSSARITFRAIGGAA